MMKKGKHKEELIESIDTDDNPRLLLRYACTIPSWALAVLNVQSMIEKGHECRVYDVQINQYITEEHPIWL